LDIRAAVDIPVGPGALSRFVSTFLTHKLVVAGTTQPDGRGDIIYQVVTPLEDHRRPPAVVAVANGAQLSSDPIDFWNVFVRPSDHRGLSIAPDGLQLHTGSIQAGAIPISKVTNGEFQSITGTFIDQLAASESTKAVAETLRGAASYNDFLRLLKQEGPVYYAHWSKHRREQLRLFLTTRLASSGLSLNAQQQVLNTIDQSQQERKQQLRQNSLERMLAPVVQPRGSVDDSELLARELMKSMVDQMTLDELRSLPISFGRALDALTKLRRPD
jgi:hypothetical protein